MSQFLLFFVFSQRKAHQVELSIYLFNNNCFINFYFLCRYFLSMLSTLANYLICNNIKSRMKSPPKDIKGPPKPKLKRRTPSEIKLEQLFFNYSYTKNNINQVLKFYQDYDILSKQREEFLKFIQLNQGLTSDPQQYVAFSIIYDNLKGQIQPQKSGFFYPYCRILEIEDNKEIKNAMVLSFYKSIQLHHKKTTNTRSKGKPKTQTQTLVQVFTPLKISETEKMTISTSLRHQYGAIKYLLAFPFHHQFKQIQQEVTYAFSKHLFNQKSDLYKIYKEYQQSYRQMDYIRQNKDPIQDAQFRKQLTKLKPSKNPPKNFKQKVVPALSSIIKKYKVQNNNADYKKMFESGLRSVGMIFPTHLTKILHNTTSYLVLLHTTTCYFILLHITHFRTFKKTIKNIHRPFISRQKFKFARDDGVCFNISSEGIEYQLLCLLFHKKRQNY